MVPQNLYNIMPDTLLVRQFKFGPLSTRSSRFPTQLEDFRETDNMRFGVCLSELDVSVITC